MTWLRQLFDLEIGAAKWVLVLMTLSVAGAALVASGLELRTEISALLPDDYPSVREFSESRRAKAAHNSTLGARYSRRAASW